MNLEATGRATQIICGACTQHPLHAKSATEFICPGCSSTLTPRDIDLDGSEVLVIENGVIGYVNAGGPVQPPGV
ncbi:hypothetical protein ACH4N9_37915, partial [Streptomyces luteogriseus]